MRTYCLLVFCYYSIATNAQNVGIGTTTPQVPLHIIGTGSEMLRLQSTDPYIGFRNASGAYKGFVWQGPGEDMNLGTAFGSLGMIRLSTAGITNLAIAANGNVGINNVNPLVKLHISSSGESIRLNGTNPYISFYNGSGVYRGFLQQGPNDDDMTMGTEIGSTGRLRFATGGTLAMVVNSLQRVGIGTGLPLARLHVDSDNEAIRISGSNSYISFNNDGDYNGYLWSKGADDIELATATGNTNGNLSIGVKGLPVLTVQNNSRVRVGALPCTITIPDEGTPPLFSVLGSLGIRKSKDDQASEWALCHSGGNILNFFYNGIAKAYVFDTDGSWHSYSDRSLKEKFEQYKTVLDEIKNIEVLTYHYKSDNRGKRSFGLVAQNVQQYFPEIVSAAGPDGLLALDYSKTGVLAIKAIQEQQKIIEDLNQEIEKLQQQVNGLIGEMQTIKKVESLSR